MSEACKHRRIENNLSGRFRPRFDQAELTPTTPVPRRCSRDHGGRVLLPGTPSHAQFGRAVTGHGLSASFGTRRQFRSS
jgi:hypothetical protein